MKRKVVTTFGARGRISLLLSLVIITGSLALVAPGGAEGREISANWAFCIGTAGGFDANSSIITEMRDGTEYVTQSTVICNRRVPQPGGLQISEAIHTIQGISTPVPYDRNAWSKRVAQECAPFSAGSCNLWSSWFLTPSQY